MTVRYLLDTNVVSEALAAKPDPAVLVRLERHRAELSIAAVVWHELVFGARRLAPGKRRDILERYLKEVVAQTLPILPYDSAAAEWHADERARLQGQGLAPAFVDGQIAAVARVNGLVLVTRNMANFAQFKGLKIENWFLPPENGGRASKPAQAAAETEPRRRGARRVGT